MITCRAFASTTKLFAIMYLCAFTFCQCMYWHCLWPVDPQMMRLLNCTKYSVHMTLNMENGISYLNGFLFFSRKSLHHKINNSIQLNELIAVVMRVITFDWQFFLRFRLGACKWGFRNFITLPKIKQKWRQVDQYKKKSQHFDHVKWSKKKLSTISWISSHTQRERERIIYDPFYESGLLFNID